MKKIYTLISALVITAGAHAQLVDFESATLTPESYDNGSSLAGDFIFDELSFNNSYDTTWGSWSGFAISNVTDNTTAGWGNQYSAFPGGGNAGSANYAVAYSNPLIMATVNYVSLMSFKITNNTYAAISMRDGDAFAKQFGSPNDANGQPDGTNGEDFFKLWVIGLDFQSTPVDSFEIYLADYRFSDSTQDYIVDSWIDVNVYDSLGFAVSGLDFRFESSDNGQFGMNTPAYFAIDDVNFAYPIGIEELEEAQFVAYPNPVQEVLSVKGGKGELTVMNASGRTIHRGNHDELSEIDFAALSAGVYFVQLATESGTTTQKIVK